LNAASVTRSGFFLIEHRAYSPNFALGVDHSRRLEVTHLENSSLELVREVVLRSISQGLHISFRQRIRQELLIGFQYALVLCKHLEIALVEDEGGAACVLVEEHTRLFTRYRVGARLPQERKLGEVQARVPVPRPPPVVHTSCTAGRQRRIYTSPAPPCAPLQTNVSTIKNIWNAGNTNTLNIHRWIDTPKWTRSLRWIMVEGYPKGSQLLQRRSLPGRSG
jgi:hypothetical protein